VKRKREKSAEDRGNGRERAAKENERKEKRRRESRRKQVEDGRKIGPERLSRAGEGVSRPLLRTSRRARES
jgi:hypothetical protein